MNHTVNITSLEAQVLEACYDESAGNGHDFGLTEMTVGSVGKKQLGALLTSLQSKGILYIHSDGVKTDSGIWHQFEFTYGSKDKHEAADNVCSLLDSLKAQPVDEAKPAKRTKKSKTAPAPVTTEDSTDEEPVDGEEADECYVVIIHNADDSILEMTAVPATASRFARRMARKEWVAAGHSADGIEFNARAAGPNL